MDYHPREEREEEREKRRRERRGEERERRGGDNIRMTLFNDLPQHVV